MRSCWLLLKLTCCILACHFTLASSSDNEPRLPLYVGVSYDLLRGNPQANTVDPGFGFQIFNLTYNRGQTTEDGLFYIPDCAVSRIRSSCSYESSSNTYTGTQGYQKTLSVSVSASGKFLGQKFTASADYKRVENSTQSQTSVIIQQGASCEVYSIEIPVFSTLKVTDDFRQAAIRAYTQNGSSWSEFMNIFGTHFAASTVMGGRLIMQTKMSSQSYQSLLSTNVDVRLQAKLSFLASLSVKSSVSSQTSASQAFTSKVEETVSINVGGQPPLTGNWLDWQQALKNAPAPISYTLVDIPVLFTSWNFPELTPLQLYIMTDSYLNFLQFSYCNVVNCSPPGIDPALPTKFSRYPVLWYNNIAVGCSFGDTQNQFTWRNYGQSISTWCLNTEDANACMTACQMTPPCTHFNWNSNTSCCTTMIGAITKDGAVKTDASMSCGVLPLTWTTDGVNGSSLGVNCRFMYELDALRTSIISSVNRTTGPLDCYQQCQRVSGCNHYYREKATGLCSLLYGYVTKDYIYTDFKYDCGLVSTNSTYNNTSTYNVANHILY